MERHLDEELNKLKSELLLMATLTEKAIHHSVEALKQSDKALAQSVIDDDNKIDEKEIEINESAIELLALFQPMAKDLRFITTGMRINSELEEIADLAVNNCNRVLRIAQQPPLKPLVDIPKLAQNAKWMVKNAIDAFVTEDEKLAKEVILSDSKSNELRNHIADELVNEYMVKDGATAPRAVPLLLYARDLERICDHAAAISEDVIYMLQAKYIKHHRERLLTAEEE